ncbi:C-type lectin lectoxin-Phi2 [Triplophysa tibetana]|uniref:C-type lectin lectoxin-Phi2 n=1 Tax=Triplophysa tibetana TaxID=1572043 RepID=A0A5A9PKY0_9TELE|nr:C-type lectin lectoxin-Phi2 [Triplophysa tibetana]
MERLIHVLLFSGLCLLTQATSSQYVLIQEKKTWHEAQAYCRQNHNDLATFQSIEDWTHEGKKMESSFTQNTWIGLYNAINSWRWSYRDENITFKLWSTGEPNNGKEECAVIESGNWLDYPCEHKFRFVCYNENGTNKFIFITHFLTTWLEAQSYCRQHYTDLAIIQSPSENDQLASMTQGYSAWIGLYRDSWMWSDGSKVNTISIYWLTGQPDVTGLNQPCCSIRADGLIEDRLCSDVLPFICLNYSRKQIVRVEVKSGKKLNDSVVMETILQFIKEKARDHGIDEETRLTWKVHSDGNVFSAKHDQKHDARKTACV